MGGQIVVAEQEDEFSCNWLFSKAKNIHSVWITKSMKGQGAGGGEKEW